MNLTHLTDKTLLNDTIEYAKKEKHYSALVIKCIAEVGKRKAFVTLGYRSLYEFCLKELKFSEAQAMRRIEAAKIVNEIPEVQEKLQSGAVNLTQLNALTPLFKEKNYSPEEKKKIITQIEHLPTREVQKLVFASLGQEKQAQEKSRVVNSTQTELTVVLDEETFKMMKELRERMLHEGIKDYSQMIKKICEKELKSRQEKFPNKRLRVQVKESKASTRHIPTQIKRQVWNRALGVCEFMQTNSTSPSAPKVKCAARFGLEFHHLTPYSLEQKHDPNNLQLLCKTHHDRQTYQWMGRAFVDFPKS